MPHGDFSDAASFTCFVSGVATLAKPSLWFAGVGPLKPMLDGPETPELLACVRMVGGFLLCLAPIFFVVRWNTINGKAGALGCFFAAATSASNALSLDGGFALRPWWLLSAFLIATACHLAFNANPMLTSAMLLEKEKAKAAKGK